MQAVGPNLKIYRIAVQLVEGLSRSIELFRFWILLSTTCMFLNLDLLWGTAPPTYFWMLSQTHVNGWSRVIASQNGGLTDYIFPFRLKILQWSCHLFNYCNKKENQNWKISHFINLKLNLHWSYENYMALVLDTI